jgi:hypothetical protein
MFTQVAHPLRNQLAHCSSPCTHRSIPRCRMIRATVLRLLLPWAHASSPQSVLQRVSDVRRTLPAALHELSNVSRRLIAGYSWELSWDDQPEAQPDDPLATDSQCPSALSLFWACMSADFAPEIADNRIHFLFSKSASQLAGSNSHSSAPNSCCTVYSCRIGWPPQTTAGSSAGPVASPERWALGRSAGRLPSVRSFAPCSPVQSLLSRARTFLQEAS